MADESTLLPGVLERLIALQTADVAIGIPTYNHGDTVGHVVESVRAALMDPLSGIRGVVINADGGSSDDTVERFGSANPDATPVVQLTYPVPPGQKLTAADQDVPDKGRALKAIFRAAKQLQAKACVILPPTLRGLTPAAVAALARPVLDGDVDFVSPYYNRHKFDGLVTSGLVYPVFRALYGKRIRYPMGGACAVSARVADHYLAQQAWDSDKGRVGVDLWMTTEAIHRGFTVAQTRVGAVTRVLRDTAPDLSATLAQVLTGLFDLAIRDVSTWQRVRGSEEMPLLGVAAETPLADVAVDPQRMVESFTLGFKNLHPVWNMFLPPATMLILKRMATMAPGAFLFPDAAWARTVFDFALAYRLRTISRDHLLGSFAPLYLAWAASYATAMATATPAQAEHRLESLCLAFEAEKPYLISRWRWPDRFSP